MFSHCPSCNKYGKGVKAAMFYSMAYTKRQWVRKPECENCGTIMQLDYEVKTDD